MRPDPRERALRRLVVSLAKSGAADVEAVLAELAPRQRDQVAGLLAACRDGAPAEPATVTPIVSGMAALDGLSPWLASRLEAGSDEAPNGMTPTAAAALKAAATALQREGGAARQLPRPRPQPARGRSLLGQVRHGLLRGRRAS